MVHQTFGRLLERPHSAEVVVRHGELRDDVRERQVYRAVGHAVGPGSRDGRGLGGRVLLEGTGPGVRGGDGVSLVASHHRQVMFVNY